MNNPFRGFSLKSVANATKKTAQFVGQQVERRHQLKMAQVGNAQGVDIEPSAKTFYDGLTSLLIQIIGLVAPLLIACVLTIGNGYFFSGFHQWTLSDPLVIWAYIGGGVLEAVGLGLVYRAARRYRKGDYKGLMFTFIWLLVLMVGSIFAQYMFLQGLYTNGILQVPDTAAEHAPIFSALVGIGGLRGHDIVFFVRAVLFHLGELACSFVVVDKAKTASQIIAERREIHDAQIAMERQEVQLQRERDEAKQEAEIKMLQHQWLLHQVRQGVVYVNAEVDGTKQLPEDKGYKVIGNGHSKADDGAFTSGQTN